MCRGADVRTILCCCLAAAVLGGCQAGQVICTGVVVDAAGEPVAGARVRAYVPEREYRDIMGRLDLIGLARAGSAGRFTLGLPAGAAEAVLVAEKPPLAIGWTRLNPEAGERTAEITLATATVLAGAVVDEKGRPVPGAQVQMILLPRGDRRGADWLMGGGVIRALTARTGAEGQFRFDNVPTGRSAEFHVRASGRGTLTTLFGRGRSSYAPPAEDIKLVLPGEAKIEATVVAAETGEPPGGVALKASNYRATWPALGAAVPGKAGRFRWEGLRPGRYDIALAQPAGGLAEWAAAAIRVEVEAGQVVADVKVELVRGGVVEVALVDAEDGSAVGGGYVSIGSPGRRRGLRSGAGKDGLARARLVPGQYQLQRASARGYARLRRDKAFTIEAGKTVRVEVALQRTPRFAGVVRDPAGRAAAGAAVCVLPGREYVKTRPDGKFEVLEDLQRWPIRTRFPVIARLAERGLAAAADVEAAATGVELKLRPGATLVGRVVGPGGEGVRAGVTVSMGKWAPDELPRLGRQAADRAGRFEIKALPPGRDYALDFKARGYMAAEVRVAAADARAGRVELPTVRLRRVATKPPAPVVTRVELPAIEGADAIWGSVGRDSRGHIWIGVTMDEKIEQPSAHLVEYDPKADKAYDRGDVVSALRRCGVWREGEGQLKIHSRICQADDGHLYFVSMDEAGEDIDARKLPKWGSHLWRYRIQEKRWEHLLRAPEALMTLAAGKRHVYALGYFGHKLYRYDTATGNVKSVAVGAVDAHITRNMFTGPRDHVYVPRVVVDQAAGRAVATLVEFDSSLRQIAETPLRRYLRSRPFNAHGIISFQRLPGGSIAFSITSGYLTLVRPSAAGAAAVEPVGWFHPNGSAYVGSMFRDDTGRRLAGVVRGGSRRGHQWVVYDLKTRTAGTAPFEVSEPKGLSLDRDLLYGSGVRDDAGNCYVVGRHSLGFGRRSRGFGGGPRAFGRGHEPIVLKVAPAKAR